jgi:hypothetical protein
MIDKEDTIETCAHFSSPSELIDGISYHNTFIIIIWKEA